MPVEETARRVAALEGAVQSYSGPVGLLRGVQRQANRLLIKEFRELAAEGAEAVKAAEAALAEAERTERSARQPLDRLLRRAADLEGEVRALQDAFDREIGAAENADRPVSEKELLQRQTQIARRRAALADARAQYERVHLAWLDTYSATMHARDALFLAREAKAGRDVWAREYETQEATLHQHPEDQMTYE